MIVCNFWNKQNCVTCSLWQMNYQQKQSKVRRVEKIWITQHLTEL